MVGAERKRTLCQHCWVLEPSHQPPSLLIRTQTLQDHPSLGVGRERPDVHFICSAVPWGPALSPRVSPARAEHSQLFCEEATAELSSVTTEIKASSPGYQAQTAPTQHTRRAAWPEPAAVAMPQAIWHPSASSTQPDLPAALRSSRMPPEKQNPTLRSWARLKPCRAVPSVHSVHESIDCRGCRVAPRGCPAPCSTG